jgi:predicted PurR-regulated permease PerM
MNPSPSVSPRTESSHPRWATAVAFVTAAALVWLLWQVRVVLLLCFAGVLGAVLLCTCSDLLGRLTHWSRRVGITVVLILMISAGVALAYLAAPSLSEQVAQLREKIEAAMGSLDRWIHRNADNLPVDDAEELGEQVANGGGVWKHVLGVFSSTLGAISAVAIISVIAIFLAYDSQRYLAGVLRLVPLPRRQRASEVLATLYSTLSRWLIAQVISMIFLAVTTWIALALLGVPLALMLAVLTGLMTFIPYLGPLIAAIPIILVAFVGSPALAVTAGVTYFIIQTLESNILMPLVYQRTVHLPAALTLVAEIFMGSLMGLPGFILATPLAAVILIAVRMLYVQDRLGDDLQQPVAELDTFRHPHPPQ